ncbi:UNVERIFIED_CONTAM: hypothetical protein K2H54_056190 [Gekko kuhli]
MQLAAQGPVQNRHDTQIGQVARGMISAQNGLLAPTPFQAEQSHSPGFNIPARIPGRTSIPFFPRRCNLLTTSSSPSALPTPSERAEKCQTNTHAQLPRQPPIFLLLLPRRPPPTSRENRDAEESPERYVPGWSVFLSLRSVNH